ncbi:cytochrome P450 Tp4149-like [Andrographis paniculata]|uniref:cytochrome P450 Tp4149-like n=1 Tax=Andrographis paniculata TaxID=175694 RepID=UPI0021E731EC|nr:cytochrome P450 Tp4149-like [Andrographis paniculata]
MSEAKVKKSSNSHMMEKMMNLSEFYPSLLALIVIYFMWLLAVNLFSYRKTKNLPPSPLRLPIIGNLHLIGDLPHRSLASLSKKYGPLMTVHLGNKPVVVISSAEVAKEATKIHDVSFSGKPVLLATKQLFYGRKGLIFSPYGEQWRKLRSIYVNKLLHKRMIKSFKSIRDEETAVVVESLEELSSTSQSVDLNVMFKSLANDIICNAAFGMKFRKGEFGKKILHVIEETVRLLFTFTMGEFIPWLAWTNRFNGFDAAIDKVVVTKDELLDSGIQDYVGASTLGNNFADIIFAGLYSGNTPGMSVDRDMLKATIQDVLGAGTDTTSTALGWAMTELIRQPKIMKKLRDEITEVMKEKKNITDEELDQMHYMKAVVKETLRLHSPVPIGLRETTEDVHMMGYDIPSGTMVMFNLWAICRDPACWDEPEKFIPERFLNSSIEYNGSDFQFIPFGAGRRICPGIYFATASVEHVLANLIYKFDWELANGCRGEDLDVIEKPGLAVGRKNPLLVVPKKSCI